MLPQDRLLHSYDQQAEYYDKAHQWGKEDALNGIHARGAEYFLICGAAWNAYLEGYSVGLQLRKVDAAPEEMSEIEYMDYVLETLRNKEGQGGKGAKGQGKNSKPVRRENHLSPELAKEQTDSATLQLCNSETL